MSAAPVRILVVDDEPPIRKLLRMGLTAHGYEVLEASNGRIALEMLAKKPHLVILDLGLARHRWTGAAAENPPSAG